MFIIKRKMLLWCAVFLFSVCSLSFINESNDALETSALPVSNKVIVLDAGHGTPDDGAVGVNGVTENLINLNITLKVQKLLEQSGATVVLTRSDENGIYDLDKTTLREMKNSDIKNRVKIGNSSAADIFVSIHLNKTNIEKYYGWQTFFKKNNEDSITLARAIQSELNATIEKDNKRESLSISDIYIVDNVEIPITIVECGFISNNEEASLLQTDEYQEKLAWGIYTGIIEYFNIKSVE